MIKYLTFLLLSLFVYDAQGQLLANKTFYQFFVPQHHDKVVVFIDTTNTKIRVFETNHKTLIVQTKIYIQTSHPDHILERLYKYGRYHSELIEDENADEALLTLKHKRTPLRINQQFLNEKIIYTIGIPKGMEHEIMIPEIDEFTNFWVSLYKD